MEHWVTTWLPVLLPAFALLGTFIVVAIRLIIKFDRNSQAVETNTKATEVLSSKMEVYNGHTTEKLEDHEHRITVLETKLPNRYNH